MTAVRLGSDVLLDGRKPKSANVGVVCNPASIDASFRHVIDRLAGAEDVTLRAIFGPQHGFRSDVQDNMIETPHAEDAVRRVPIYSLYSETREPTARMLNGVDVLVVDLQDIGAPTACAAAPATASRFSSAIGRTRSAAVTSKARCCVRASNRSWASFRFRCDTV